MRPAPAELGSPLAGAIQRFVAYKRALNRRYETEEQALRLLDRYLVERSITDLAGVTPDVFSDFLSSRPRSRPRSYNHLLGVARRLFNWMVEQETLAVSPVRLRPRRETTRRIPYLFDLPRARRLIEVATALPDNNKAPQRGPTYATIFALLYGLGLRVGEVARLSRADVDLDRRLLVIRETKFAKSRLVPFGPRMFIRLAGYVDLRERRSGPLMRDAPMFTFTAGRPIHPGTITQTFHALVPRLGLTLPVGVASPRLHDLRHSFAVGTLLRWYRDDADPAARLLHLSTFLGHVDPASTAVYLTITADLLRAASTRFERFARPLSNGRRAMTSLGPLVYAFFERHLKAEQGLSPASVRSYSDTLRLFLAFIAGQRHRPITRLAIQDLTAERVRQFLGHLEAERGNHIRTRNQRLAGLHTFFAYLAGQAPETLAEAERVTAIPSKRVSPPGTQFLQRDEIEALFASLPQEGHSALRDRALLLFLYNTGARVQEAADLTAGNLVLEPQPRVHLHGKGDKWRTCPLWPETARLLRDLLAVRSSHAPDDPVFISRHGGALTRFGIYKLVRRHAACLSAAPGGSRSRRVSPHVLRHTTAVHLLEAGVEVNVIRGWLGHVSLDTTNRYAEINIRSKEAALRVCAPPTTTSAAFPRRPVWRDDTALLDWLASL